MIGEIVLLGLTLAWLLFMAGWLVWSYTKADWSEVAQRNA